ncbi:hypothetical protein YTCETSXE_CDS0084 [Staphylococcus phage MVC_VPHSA2]|nr:hypothetical protein YTCETSXE_CDS0084 [Staphylococcus phage MVC_VPHSA2]
MHSNIESCRFQSCLLLSSQLVDVEALSNFFPLHVLASQY